MITSPDYGAIVPVNGACELADALNTTLLRQCDRELISAWWRGRTWDRVAVEVLEELRAVVASRTPQP